MGHGETCGHCGSEVRAGFTACTGCGATYRGGTGGTLAILFGVAIMGGGALFLAVGVFALFEGTRTGGAAALGGGLLACLFFLGVIALGRFFFRLGMRANRPMWYR